MQPYNRTADGSFPIPKLLINKEDVSGFLRELEGFHAQFADCFSRQEPRDNFFQYMVGQMSHLERKSIEPIALSVEDAKVRAMQHFISDVVWDEARIVSRYRGMVADDMGDAEGILIFDETSFVKKGNYVGVTLEMIDRDDVGAVRALPRRLGYAANRTLSAAVAALFTANGGVGPNLADTNPLFDAATHGNLLQAALDATAWDTVVQAMYKQAEFHSAKRLGVRPAFCLVPIELEKTALTIFTSDLEPGTPDNGANVRRYSGQVITVPEWSDPTDWAAAADPAELEGVCIGYRFGRAPELYIAGEEQMGSMFTNDEMRLKVRFVYAVGIGDYRALHKNNVADG